MNFKNLKIKNFKWKRNLTVLSFLAVIIVPISLLLVNWSDIRIIYAAGSSAVAPLLTKLDATYRENATTNKNIEINILSTGSGNGFESAVNGLKNFGNVSYAPDKKRIVNTVDIKAFDGWTNRQIKTFTIGIDGIGIVYKPGNLDFSLNINKDNITKLYEAISGESKYSYSAFGSIDSPLPNIPLVPYARAGGANKSGTTDAFLKDNGLGVKDATANYYQRLISGDYGANVESTRESNVETWKQISSNGGTVGAITYLSAGFIINNMDAIKGAGFSVATYKPLKPLDPADPNKVFPPQLDNISKGYNWYRPLNILLSVIDPNPAVKLWAEWLYNNYQQPFIDAAIKEIGIVPLSRDQLNSMKTKDEPGKSGIFWASDFTIMSYDLAESDYKWGAQL